MSAKNNSSGEEGKTKKHKFGAVKWILAVLVVLLAVLFFGVPAFLSSSAGTGYVANKVSESMDGKVEMGDLNVGWFKGVHLQDFSFVDNKGMAKVNIRKITAKPKYSSMLGGNMSLGEVVVLEPEVWIRLEKEKITDKPSDKPEEKGEDEEFELFFNQIDLTVKDGDVKILPADGDVNGTIHFSNIGSRVDLNPAGERSSFEANMNVVSNGQNSQISAEGNVKSSKKGWSFKNSSGEMKVKVEELKLASLSPVLALFGKDVDVQGKLNVDADVKIGDGQVKKLVVDGKLENFKHTTDGKVISLEQPVTLTGRVSTKQDKVNIENFDLKSSFLTVTGKGTGSKLDYVARMDIAKTMNFVGSFVDLGDYDFSGSGYEEGSIIFDNETIRVSDYATVDNFVIEQKGKKTPSTSAKFTFDMLVDMAKEEVKIGYLTMDTQENLADIEIQKSRYSWANDADQKLDMNVFANVSLAEIEPFMKFFGAVPDKMNLAGDVKSNLSVDSSDGTYRIFTKNTTISGLKIATEGVEEKFEDDMVNIKLDMTVDPEEKVFELKEFLLDGSKIDIEGNLTQKKVQKDMSKVSGKLKADYDLSAVSSIASAYVPGGIEISGKRSDVFTFESKYAANKLLANMNGSGNFGFASAKYMGMKFGEVDVNVNVNEGQLKISPFSTSVNKGTFRFAGGVDLTKEPMLFTIPKPIRVIEEVQIDEEMGKELLKYLNPLFAKQTDISGTANLYCEKVTLPLGGESMIKDAEIVGTVAMDDVRMQNKGLLGIIMSKGIASSTMRAKMLPSKIVLDDGIISYDDMQMNIEEVYPINFSGSINLNTEPGKLDMTAALPYTLRLRKGGLKPLKVGENKQGRIKVPVEGTVNASSIDWAKALKGAGGGAVEDYLKEGLEGLFDKGDKDGKKKSPKKDKSEDDLLKEGLERLF